MERKREQRRISMMQDEKHLSGLKQHLPYILIILLIAVIALWPYIKPGYFKNYIGDVDIGNFISVNHINIKETITEYNQFPLWDKYKLSGTPLFAGPQVGVLSLTTLLDLVLPASYAAVKLSLLFYLILAGIGMYILILNFGLEKKYAIIASMLYMMNGTAGYFIYSYTFWSHAYASLPFIILCLEKAWASKKWTGFCMLAGLIWALALLAGSDSGFLYIGMLVGLHTALRAIGNGIGKRAVKGALILGMTLLFCFGVASVKLLPVKEFIDQTYRQGKFPYEFFLGNGHHITSDNIKSYLIDRPETSFPIGNDGSGEIGYLALALGILSLGLYRQKKVFMFWVMLIFIILYMMKSPISYLVWKYVPIFGQQKNLDKALLIYNFIVPVLAAYGAMFCFEKLKHMLNKRVVNGLFMLLLVAVPVENGMLNWLSVQFTGDGFEKYKAANEYRKGNYYNMPKDIQETEVLQYITQDNETFRMKYNHFTLPHDGASSFTVPLGIEDVYGNTNMWHSQYPAFIQLSEARSLRPRMYGMLNVKYLVSQEPVNETGFRLIKTFKKPKDENYYSRRVSHGEYLYENQEFMPRAYIADKAVLVIGDDDKVTDMVYTLISYPDFDPKASVLVHGKKIQDYSMEELKRYSAVVLTQNLGDENELIKLKGYKDHGVLLPDIFSGRTSISQEEIKAILASGSTSGIKEISYIKETPNMDLLDVSGLQGFMVLSETYALHPGWKASTGTKEPEILRANGILSAVYLDDTENTIRLYYRPSSFVIGIIITISSILLMAAYFSLQLIKKRKGFKQHPGS